MSYGFGYIDHSLSDRAHVERMKILSRGERGIPVIVLNGGVSIAFDRHRIKEQLGLY